MTAQLPTGPFRGRFEIKLDPKGRLLIPAAYRQILPVVHPQENPQLIVTNNRYRGKSCLHAYSVHEWEKLERSIASLSSLKAEVQAFNRFYLSAGQVADVDAQNRILIPQSLRKFAGLSGPAVLVGLGNKFEIWAESTWNSLYEDLTENFESTLEAVAALETSVGKKT
jgi:MraZ protein